MAAGSVAPAPSAAENITRVLRHLGLYSAIYISRVEADRVYGWPLGDRIMRHVVLECWPADPREAVEFHHGSAIGFREPKVSPALQVVLHPAPEAPEGYFIELDLDFYAPQLRRPWTYILHGLEVARNAITGRKTDQAAIAAALDRRFAKS